MSDLFSFPNPVNETAARVVAGAVAVLAVVAVAFQQGWILPMLAYGFVARALAGPSLSPAAQLATRVVAPLLARKDRYGPGPPKRFAQAVGAAFTVGATVLWFAAGLHTAALALAGVLAVFATLESAAGFCVGCRAFYLGMRLGLVPPHVCDDCAPFVRA
jgi:Domain of unknown function (DUF4395)